MRIICTLGIAENFKMYFETNGISSNMLMKLLPVLLKLTGERLKDAEKRPAGVKRELKY